MSKHFINWDEYYPVFFLSKDRDDGEIELTDEEAARVEAADAEWTAVQDMLLERLRASGNTRF